MSQINKNINTLLYQFSLDLDITTSVIQNNFRNSSFLKLIIITLIISINSNKINIKIKTKINNSHSKIINVVSVSTSFLKMKVIIIKTAIIFIVNMISIQL